MFSFQFFASHMLDLSFGRWCLHLVDWFGISLPHWPPFKRAGFISASPVLPEEIQMATFFNFIQRKVQRHSQKISARDINVWHERGWGGRWWIVMYKRGGRKVHWSRAGSFGWTDLPQQCLPERKKIDNYLLDNEICWSWGKKPSLWCPAWWRPRRWGGWRTGSAERGIELSPSCCRSPAP